jgi:tryptophan-rich sensory protein
MRKLVPLAVAGAILCGANVAHAKPAGSSALALILSSPFVATDIVYAARPSWAPPGWAVPEVAQGAIFVSVMVANATDEYREWHRTAWVWGTLGWGMLLHGAFSLVFYRLPGTEPAPVALGIGPDGVSIAGRF